MHDAAVKHNKELHAVLITRNCTKIQSAANFKQQHTMHMVLLAWSRLLACLLNNGFCWADVMSQLLEGWHFQTT
jgi:hypothetical protein